MLPGTDILLQKYVLSASTATIIDLFTYLREQYYITVLLTTQSQFKDIQQLE